MQDEEENGRARKRRRLDALETGPYVLRDVLKDIPLAGDENDAAVSITCVEYWNNNLYIGTTAAEILHFVSLPSDAGDPANAPTFILASRLQPSGHNVANPSLHSVGVRQILVLPGPSKACVLCNGTVSFYTLPELSPAFPNKEPTGVQWIGGVDENEEDSPNPEPALMIANSKRILLVRVGEKLRPIKNNIEYPGCLKSSRRGTIACVADKQSYALLEIEYQQKIPLFPIASTNDTADTDLDTLQPPPPEPSGHGRSTSLGDFVSNIGNRRSDSRTVESGASRFLSPRSVHARSIPSPARSPDRTEGHLTVEGEGGARPRSSTETRAATVVQKALPPKPAIFQPHILSPSPTEFMLTTGSGEDEPGVGMFVNLDGDVVRGTIEFERYPDALLLDRSVGQDPSSLSRSAELDDDVVLALLHKPITDEKKVYGIESQTLTADPAASAKSKSWLPLSRDPVVSINHAGMHSTLSSCEYAFDEVGQLLRLVKLGGHSRNQNANLASSDPRTKASTEQLEEEKALFDINPSGSPSDLVSPEYETRRYVEEAKFASSLGHAQTRVLIWSEDHIWSLAKNPLLLRLEAALNNTDASTEETPEGLNTVHTADAAKTGEVFERIRNQEPRSEFEFMSLNYIRQKAALMMFLNLQQRLYAEKDNEVEGHLRITETMLLESGLDPRLVLLLIQPLRADLLLGPQGMWIHQGLNDLLPITPQALSSWKDMPLSFWMMIRRYLTSWQEKRGFGSIADEQYVFDSVDSALLHLLLQLDEHVPSGSGAQTAVRAKLHNVVDHWKGDFNRAIKLLEEYRRYFVLSRLYQSRRLAKEVLQTWKRVLEGEADGVEELPVSAVETQMRNYLVKIRDVNLVEEYALWLANRNPSLAIQVLTDDSARVKVSPQQVTPLLKKHAPAAVQAYLEYLVFGKHLQHYADDLIGYYLDSVLTVLDHSEQARGTLSQSYSTYRGLQPPKPTYLNFITQNAPKEAWWQSRLRLLQLLGSGSYASSNSSSTELTYSIPTVLTRLAPYSSLLVSESILLSFRRGQHKEALKLLVHGLADYDTAVRYCYFGSPSSSTTGTLDISELPDRDVQREMFTFLFNQFLLIENEEEQIERTSTLLGKFASFFEPNTILQDIPDSWSVQTLKEFLVRSLRTARGEKERALVVKALSAAQNLRVSVEWIDGCEKVGPTIETGEEGAQAKGIQVGSVQG